MAKKPKKPETPMDRLKFPLWQWGLIVIVAGFMANVVMGMQPAAGGSPEARAAALGRGVATMLFVITGLVLIVIHFVRRIRR